MRAGAGAHNCASFLFHQICMHMHALVACANGPGDRACISGFAQRCIDRKNPHISPPPPQQHGGDHSKQNKQQTTKGIGLRCGFKLSPDSDSDSDPPGDVIWICMHSTCVCGSFFIFLFFYFGDSLVVHWYCTAAGCSCLCTNINADADDGRESPGPPLARARAAARTQ